LIQAAGPQVAEGLEDVEGGELESRVIDLVGVEILYEVRAKAHAAMHPLRDANRKLTESETRAIVPRVDEILGLSSEARHSSPNSLRL
jgi:hypothetical protein